MSYKLYYFNLTGRAETCRLIFAAAGKVFEDFRFTREEWPQYKPKSPSGQAPFLETPEGTLLVQSRAIQRYLGNKFGLYGSTAEEKYIIDAVSDTLGEMLQELGTMFYSPDEEAKQKAAENFYTVKGPALLSLLTKFISEGKPGAVAGGKTSWADFEILAVSEWFDRTPELKAFQEKYSEVFAHAQSVKEIPEIAAYLAKRPANGM